MCVDTGAIAGMDNYSHDIRKVTDSRGIYNCDLVASHLIIEILK